MWPLEELWEDGGLRHRLIEGEFEAMCVDCGKRSGDSEEGVTLSDRRGSERVPDLGSSCCVGGWGPVAKRDCPGARQTWICISDPRSKLLRLSVVCFLPSLCRWGCLQTKLGYCAYVLSAVPGMQEAHRESGVCAGDLSSLASSHMLLFHVVLICQGKYLMFTKVITIQQTLVNTAGVVQHPPGAPLLPFTCKCSREICASTFSPGRG